MEMSSAAYNPALAVGRYAIANCAAYHFVLGRAADRRPPAEPPGDIAEAIDQCGEPRGCADKPRRRPAHPSAKQRDKFLECVAVRSNHFDRLPRRRVRPEEE